MKNNQIACDVLLHIHRENYSITHTPISPFTHLKSLRYFLPSIPSSPIRMLSPAGQALLTHLLVKVKWCLNITWVGSRKVQPTSTLCTYPGSALVSQVPVARHTQTQQYSPYSQTDSDYHKSEIILLNPIVNLTAQIQWKVNQKKVIVKLRLKLINNCQEY